MEQPINQMINHELGFNRFNNLANYLMNKCILKIGEIEYELMEIEFYFYNEKIHKDINTHCSESQKKSNTWYLHQLKNNLTFKSGNYKGLDITFGDENSYGGILIRGIKSNNEIIAGPSNTVSKIMENLSFEINDMQSFADLIFEQNIYTNNSLKIIEKENINSSILFRSSRVGLVKSDDYSPCPYRYIKNNSEYRKHSNFKDKTLVFYYSLVLGIDSNEIKNFANLKNLDFDKFLKNLNNKKELNSKIYSFLEDFKR